MKKIFTLLVATFFVASLFAQTNPGMKVTVKSPASLGGQFVCVSASFGGVLELDKPICAEAILANAPTVGSTSKEIGCDSLQSNVKGKIALVRRGTCNFSLKCFNAQKAGAIGCLIINNAAGAGAVGMAAGTNGADVTIPCAMISLEDGNKIAAALATGKVELCLVLPSRSISQATAADAIQIPFAQRDTVYPRIEMVNSSTDTVKKVVSTVVITDPAGKITKFSTTEDIAPTAAGSVDVFLLGKYYPTAKGKYSLTFTSTFSPLDTFRNQFILTDYNFANDNGIVTQGNGLGLAATQFGAAKISNIVGVFNVLADTKATFVSFGLANYAQMKGRPFAIEVYEGDDAIVGADIPAATTSLGDIGALVGDVTDYIVKGTEVKNSLLTLPLTTGGKKGIALKKDKTYLFAVTYDGAAFKDSLAPLYATAEKFAIRGSRTDVAGTALMTGPSYFSAGFSGNQGMVLRAHMDGFVGAKDLPVLEANEVSIAPNPATNNVNVALNLNDPAKDVQIGIMDMTGRIIEIIKVGATQKENVSIDVSNYTPGTYFLTVKTEKAFRPEKFVKVN